MLLNRFPALPILEALALTTDDPETKKIRAEYGIGDTMEGMERLVLIS